MTYDFTGKPTLRVLKISDEACSGSLTPSEHSTITLDKLSINYSRERQYMIHIFCNTMLNCIMKMYYYILLYIITLLM